MRLNLTSTIVDQAAANSAASTSDAAVLVFQQPYGRSSSDAGFSEFVQVPGNRIPNVTLELSMFRGGASLVFAFGPFPDYDIAVTPEVLDLWLLPAWFASGGLEFCGAVEGQPFIQLASVTVEPQAEALLASTKAINDAVGDTALVASVAASSAGPVAGDVTSVAVLSSMSCARPSQREAGSNARLLSPLPMSDSVAGRVLGNFVVSLVVIALHGAVTIGAVQARGGFGAVDVFSTVSLLRFPSLSVAALGVLHQGTAFYSLRLVVGGVPGAGAGDVVVGVLGMLYAVAMPLGAVYVAVRQIDATYMTYVYGSDDNNDDAELVSEAARQQGTSPARWLQMLLPRGRWEPREMRRAYGVMLSPFERANPYWFLFVFLSPSVIALGAAPAPSTRSGCMQQYAVIAALQMLYVGLLSVFRPYRSAFANVTSALSASTVALVAMASALAISDPRDEGPVRFSAAVMLIQGGLTVARVSYAVLCAVGESKLLAGVRQEETLRRVPRVPKTLIVEGQTPLLGDFNHPPVLMASTDTVGKSLENGMLVDTAPISDDLAMFDDSIEMAELDASPHKTTPPLDIDGADDDLLPDAGDDIDSILLDDGDASEILNDSNAVVDEATPPDLPNSTEAEADMPAPMRKRIASEVLRGDLANIMRTTSSNIDDLLGAMGSMDAHIARVEDDVLSLSSHGSNGSVSSDDELMNARYDAVL